MKMTIQGILLASGVLATATVLAAPPQQAGEITHLSGVLSVKRGDGSARLISVKSGILEGDTLSTEQDTYARVKFVDGAEMVLRPGTQVTVNAYRYDADKPESDNVLLSMLKGGLRSVTGLLGKRSRERVSVQTSTATIGIRGTTWSGQLCQNDCGGIPSASGKPLENGLHLEVVDGAIVVSNGAGQIPIGLGQFGFVRDNGSPPVLVPQEQGFKFTVPSGVGHSVSSSDSQCTM